MVPWFLSHYQLLDFEKKNATFRAFKNQPKNAIILFDASIFDCFKWCELIFNITIKSIKHTFHPVPCSKSLWSLQNCIPFHSPFFQQSQLSFFGGGKFPPPPFPWRRFDALSSLRKSSGLSEKAAKAEQLWKSWNGCKTVGILKTPFLEEKVGGFIPLETYIG